MQIKSTQNSVFNPIYARKSDNFMRRTQALRSIFSVSVNQRLEKECHEPPFVFVREGKFSLHMTHALRNPDREIGPCLCGKFCQLTRVMHIDARIISSMHNIDGA